MNTTKVDSITAEERDRQFSWQETSHFSVALLCSVALNALIMVGLSGVQSAAIAGIGTMATGGLILLRGITVKPNFTLSSQALRAWMPLAGQRFIAEFFGGLAGIVLGLMCFCQVLPGNLLPAAVLILGATVVFSAITASRQHWAITAPFGAEHPGPLHVFSASGSPGPLLAACAAIGAGVIAIAGFMPVTMTLAGLLSLGLETLLKRRAAE